MLLVFVPMFLERWTCCWCPVQSLMESDGKFNFIPVPYYLSRKSMKHFHIYGPSLVASTTTSRPHHGSAISTWLSLLARSVFSRSELCCLPISTSMAVANFQSSRLWGSMQPFHRLMFCAMGGRQRCRRDAGPASTRLALTPAHLVSPSLLLKLKLVPGSMAVVEHDDPSCAMLWKLVYQRNPRYIFFHNECKSYTTWRVCRFTDRAMLTHTIHHSPGLSWVCRCVPWPQGLRG